MDREDIKGYTLPSQFREHAKMLDKLIEYNKSNRKSLAKLRSERAYLVKCWSKLDDGIKSVYWEELHRGEGGGASEADANARAGMKQLMKDNRLQSTKGTIKSRAEYREELEAWEEKNGKLDRLSRRI